MNQYKEQNDMCEQKQQADQLRELPNLWIEAHLKITDPETKKELVNTRA